MALFIHDPPVGDVTEIGAVRYGQRSGHAARRNVGDCFSCVCAMTLRVILLDKGDDFAKIDPA